MTDHVDYPCDRRTRALLVELRRAALIVLAAVEDYLLMPRSVVPKPRREDGE